MNEVIKAIAVGQFFFSLFCFSIRFCCISRSLIRDFLFPVIGLGILFNICFSFLERYVWKGVGSSDMCWNISILVSGLLLRSTSGSKGKIFLQFVGLKSSRKKSFPELIVVEKEL